MSKNLEGLEGVKIQDVDIADEDNESLLDEWKIRTVPTLIVLGESNEFIAEFKGVVPIDKIQQAINEAS